MRSRTELLETALHVLVTWNDRGNPAPADVEALRKAFPSSADLPVDELACHVIHGLRGIPCRKADLPARQSMDAVA